MQDKVRPLMPALLDDLKELVSVPSIAFPEFPQQPLLDAAEKTKTIFEKAGADSAQLLDVPGAPPAVLADFNGDPQAPTVLLYAHYDVQPAPMEQGWDTNPFEPTIKQDGRIYGRGAADDKSGIVIHAGALRALGNNRKVNVRVLIEGDEEYSSRIADLIEQQPDIAKCDVFIIADAGNQVVGKPALISALRGLAACKITVRTLDRPVHSGLFGGAVPDALTALTRIISTLHNPDGSVAVKGLQSFEWKGGAVTEESVRADSGLLNNVDLTGTGNVDLASRMWSQPAINVIGMDVPSTATASNVIIHEATALVSMRVAPGSDENHELEILMEHLRNNVPWNVKADVRKHVTGPAYQGNTSSQAIQTAKQALKEAFNEEVDIIGCGGSIPLVASVQAAHPNTEVIIWGAEDTAQARIHGSNESVDPKEIERMVLAEALLLQKLASL